MRKNVRRSLLHFAILITVSLISHFSHAQFPYSESFQNATAPGIVISGSAKLTAATGSDPAGQGYLRLTDNNTSNVGYAYCNTAFPSNYGITASFEFFMWKTDAQGYNQADGISFFLFDASVNSFRPGGTGGSLGYAQYYQIPGMAKGYMGISLDAFGNFSSATDGTKNGGPGKRAGAIAVRGPGDGKGLSDYVYQTGVTASDAPYNAGFLGFTQRFPSASSINYRKIKIILKPGSSLGASIGYKITVIMTKGGTTPTNVTLINDFDYPFAAPAQLKFGLAASTGAITNYQEIRNLSIDVTNNTSLLSPVLSPDLGTICQGEPVYLDILSNDLSNNSNGNMNRSSIDLNTGVAGIQTTYQDPGKGLYEVLSSGLVSFTPANGFVGHSTINYTASDSYGVAATSPSSITVSVGLQPAPDLTISNPTAVCFPQTVNITDPVYKIETTPGASYSYFQNLTDANSNVSNINATASSINQSGTYFIRASLSGCATIKPIVVTVSKTPTVSAAGPDQNFCSSNGGQSLTLLSNNPDVGIGT